LIALAAGNQVPARGIPTKIATLTYRSLESSIELRSFDGKTAEFRRERMEFSCQMVLFLHSRLFSTKN